MVLGYPPTTRAASIAKRALEKLLVVRRAQRLLPAVRLAGLGHGARAASRMQEEGSTRAAGSCRARARLAASRSSCSSEPGDWQRAAAEPCRRWLGVPVSSNDFYPDLDDTAVVVWAMQPRARARAAMPTRSARALDWLVGMQSSNGGFAAFDVDNTHYQLNHIPFADHGALLDPPTERCHGARGHGCWPCRPAAGSQPRWHARSRTCAANRSRDGCWFGRWGSNYIYGTWSVLMALGAGGRRARSDPAVRARRALADALPERRRRLGREQRQLRAAGARGRASPSPAPLSRPPGRCWP